jgi:sulfatase modifying factor 1
MRRFNLSCISFLLLAVLAAACGPKATPEDASPTPVVVTVVVTEAPSATPVDSSEPTLVPINLAGPEMAVGSKFLYVDGSTLVAVPGGTSLMGRGGGTDNPQREVALSDFWIYRTEVTNQQYEYCVSQGKCTTPDIDDNPSYLDPARVGDPVTGVNWQQSKSYCEFVHGRLPTEAEWEKTASWDPINEIKNVYPWGDGAPTCALLNFNNCIGKTTNVTQFPQGESAYEALDMSGNSYEWVADWYDPLFYRNGPTEDPIGPEIGQRRSIRSSGYKSNKDQAPSAVRSFDSPNNHARDLGFRCVVEDPTFYAPICELQIHYGLDANGNPIPGGSNQNCPDPVIEHYGDCAQGNTPVSNITVSVAAPSVISLITGMDAPGCLPGGNVPNVTSVCGTGIAIHAEATCELPPPPLVEPCPPGWTQDGDSCISDGGPGEACPDGYVYDPLLLCCSVIPGNDGIHCINGFHDFNGACVPDLDGLVPPSDANWTTIVEKPCGPTGYGALLESSPLYIALAEEQGQPILAPVVTEASAQSPLLSVSGILTLVGLGLVGWVTRYGRKRS